MKKFLEKLIADKKAKLNELKERSNKSEDINEVRSIGKEIDDISEEIRNAEAQLEEIKKSEQAQSQIETNNARSAFDPNKALNVVATAQMNNGVTENRNIDPLSSMEYRKAFMRYAQTGEKTETLLKILAEVRSEVRADNEVTSKELGVLIPHTVVQELIKKIEGSHGTFSSRVKMLNIPGGIEIPIADFEATFKWSGEEGNDTEHGVTKDQKVNGVTGSVKFAYYIGEVRIGQSLLQSILTVDLFENELVNALFVAYLKARDEATLRGTGVGQPTGILTDTAEGLKRIPKDNIIEFTEEEISDWTKWEKKLFSIIPIEMESESPEFAMSKQTYVSNLCTMKDANNQPINKAGFDSNDKKHKFNEYEVLRTNQTLFKSFDSCDNGEVFGLFWVPEKSYAINSNMSFGYKKYFDEDKNKWIQKGLVILDGKPTNTNYIYILKKKSSIEPQKSTIEVSIPSGETSLNLGEKTVQDLCENVSLDGDNVTGALNYVENWTEFDKTDNTGNFIPLYFEEAKGQAKGTVKCELKGTGAKLKKPVSVDPKDGLIVIQVHDKDNTIEITSDGKETRILNLSQLELKTND